MKGYKVMVEIWSNDRFDKYDEEFSGEVFTDRKKARLELESAKRDGYDAYIKEVDIPFRKKSADERV